MPRYPALLAILLMLTAGQVIAQGETDDKQLFWGDTHLHTRYSLDAYAFGNRSVSADDAFRFAQGEPVLHPLTQHRLRIRRPLDFLVVSDHAEYAGTIHKIFTADELIMQGEHGRRLAEMAKDPAQAATVLYDLVSTINNATPYEELVRPEVRTDAWRESIEAAERHNNPGTFTAFIGWEWSSLTDGANLHRVVITSADAEIAAAMGLLFSATHNVAEGAGAAPLAALLQESALNSGARVAMILSGGNVDRVLYSNVLQGERAD